MNYISLFSGIEAATVGWHDLGWKPVVFADFEDFPSAVLAHHYPQIENVGDVMKHEWKKYNGKAEIIVGGSPCQSFSVAGDRLGMDDPRGNLALKFIQIIRDVQPRWFIFENVPGLLSSDGGKDFATFIGEVAKCGYGFAYRVLDAQYFGVPQRRRRLFVIGHIDGDWRSAAAVLFERESLCRDSKPSEEKRQDSALFAGQSVEGTGRQVSAKGIVHCADVGPAMGASGPPYSRTGNERVEDEALVVQAPMQKGIDDTQLYEWHGQDSRINPIEVASSLNTNDMGRSGHLVSQAPMHDPSPTLDASYGVGAGMRAGIERQVIGVEKQTFWDGKDKTATLTARCNDQFMPDKDNFMAVLSPQQESFSRGGHGTFSADTDNKAGVLTSHQAKGADTLITESNHVVRRLTPMECERLQGFPDNYTQIPYKGKPAEECPKGHRYKALGNSMAVPVMRWLGERIQQVSDLTDGLEDRSESKTTKQMELW